jgi:hypothetical protein
MKRLCVSGIVLLGLCLAGVFPALARDAAKNETKVGDTAFAAYEGSQNWPRGERTFVNNEYSVPIYIGLPDKSYKALGRIYDQRTTGVEVVGRAFDEAFGKERLRMRNCANQARLHGADAVVVTDDKRVVEAFNLSRRELRDSAPLFDYKDSLVLAIKFE